MTSASEAIPEPLLQVDQALALGRQAALQRNLPLVERTLLPLLESAAQPTVRLDAGVLLVQAYMRMGRVAQAQGVLRRATQAAAQLGVPMDNEPWPTLARGLDTCWWEPVVGRHVTLRRPQGQDAALLKVFFKDPVFAASVNRDYGEQVIKAPLRVLQDQLDAQWHRSPLELGAYVCLVSSPQGKPLGICSLVDIDLKHSRAEFIIGFMAPMPSGLAIVESGSLMARMAFEHARLHRVTCSVYGDNPRSEALGRMLGKMGFEFEGCLQDHVKTADGRFVSVQLWGCLRHNFDGTLLQRWRAKN